MKGVFKGLHLTCLPILWPFTPMELSKRIRGLTGGGSDGWGNFYRARQMVARGEDVIELTIGEHDRQTEPEILDAMHRAALDGATGYAAIPGITTLRAAIAERVAERTGVATKTENVIVTPGAQAGLFAAHHAVCDEGDTALFIDPYYTTYPGTIRTVGARPVAVEAQADAGFQPRQSDLEAVAPGARSLLINTPNNPTGAVYSNRTLQGICEVCRTHDLWLISDEVYDTQLWSGSHQSPRALPGMADRTLVVGSLSKSHAMTGSRLGWVVGPEDAVQHMSTLALGTTYGVPGYIQEAGLFALAQGSDLEDRISAPFRRRHKVAQDILAASNVIAVVPSTATMYLMLDIRATGLSGEDFASKLLEEERIAVMPGESFGLAAAGHLRVALTTEDDRMTYALNRLMALAERLASQAA